MDQLLAHITENLEPDVSTLMGFIYGSRELNLQEYNRQKAKIFKALEFIECKLTRHKWLLGESFSLAD
jgi:glutathione S-transferase